MSGNGIKNKSDIWVEEAINDALEDKIADEQINLEEAERYAETGLSLLDISEKLNIPITQELRNVVRIGRLGGIIAVSEALYNAALNGDAEAMVFYLQNVSNWRKKVEVLNISGE